MNQFVLIQGISKELKLFPHIIELGIIKNAGIQLNAFHKTAVSGVRFFYVWEGKFHWNIHNGEHTLYPGDVVLVLPSQAFGNSNDVLEIGSFSYLHINANMQGTDAMQPSLKPCRQANELTSRR